MKNQPYATVDDSGNATIRHPDGTPMTASEITAMTEQAQAENDAFAAMTPAEQRALLDRMTGGMMSALFGDVE